MWVLNISLASLVPPSIQSFVIVVVVAALFDLIVERSKRFVTKKLLHINVQLLGTPFGRTLLTLLNSLLPPSPLTFACYKLSGFFFLPFPFAFLAPFPSHRMLFFIVAVCCRFHYIKRLPRPNSKPPPCATLCLTTFMQLFLPLIPTVAAAAFADPAANTQSSPPSHAPFRFFQVQNSLDRCTAAGQVSSRSSMRK